MSLKFNPFSGSFDYVRDVTVPIILSGDDIGLDYNTTNLKITASQLNTIQDIATSSSPTFTNLTLSGDLLFSTDVTSNIGSATKRPKLIHIGGSVGGAINTAFRGLKLTASGADYYIGDDNVSSGYYSQRAVVSGSTVSDYSQDYSNLFQGDSAYQYLALNFGITRSLGSNGVVVGDNNTGEGCSLIIGTSTTRRMELYLDYANKTFVMDGNLTSGVAANKCMKVKLELGATAPAFYPATDNKIDFGIASTNRWKDYYGMTATLSTSLTLSALTLGSIVFAGTSGILSQDNSNFFWDNTNKRLGLFTTTPTNSLSFGGTAARKIWMERHTTAGTAGNNFTIEAGGATSGATNRAGGKLILSSGIATGSQTSTAEIWTAASGTAGTGNNSPSVKLAVAGSGAQTWTQSNAAGFNGITQNFTTTAMNAAGSYGHYWTHTHTNMIDSQAVGLGLTLSPTLDSTDGGGSTAQGFAFEIFAATETAGADWAGVTAVGGFAQHSGPGTMSSMVIYNAQMNISSGAGALAAYTGYFVNMNIVESTVTLYRGLHISGKASGAGTVTGIRGIDIEDLTATTAGAYAIYSAGGQSVHAGNLKLGDTTAPTEQLEFADAKNVKFHTTTGTKIGTATSQKLSFWNATPIVQPTTGIAAATFVTNTSLIANDTATFDGYTIGQVVKALRNIGVLA